jgi:hypothetical protein
MPLSTDGPALQPSWGNDEKKAVIGCYYLSLLPSFMQRDFIYTSVPSAWLAVNLSHNQQTLSPEDLLVKNTGIGKLEKHLRCAPGPIFARRMG